jgi:hypothetical protein
MPCTQARSCPVLSEGRRRTPRTPHAVGVLVLRLAVGVEQRPLAVALATLNLSLRLAQWHSSTEAVTRERPTRHWKWPPQPASN